MLTDSSYYIVRAELTNSEVPEDSGQRYIESGQWKLWLNAKYMYSYVGGVYGWRENEHKITTRPLFISDVF